VAAAHDQARQLMAELRELIHGIQPQILTDLGLPAALDELAGQSAIPVTVGAQLDGRLPGQVENTAYFAVAEALTNIAKHSGATQASVQARIRDRTLIVEVTDNGRAGAAPGRGSGLTGLASTAMTAARGSPARSRPSGRGPGLRATPQSSGSWSGRTIPRSAWRSTMRYLTSTAARSS
jgi:signal transduction histidine kinase